MFQDDFTNFAEGNFRFAKHEYDKVVVDVLAEATVTANPSPSSSTQCAESQVRDNGIAGSGVAMAKDDRRRPRVMDMKDAVLRAPSVCEKVIAARTRTYHVGNVLGAQTADRRIAKRTAVERAARHRRKQREKQLKEYCRTLERRIRVPDPRSDDEGTGRA